MHGTTLNRMRRIALLLVMGLLVSALTGCGFKLRGSTDLPSNLKELDLRIANTVVKEELLPFLEQGGISVFKRDGTTQPDAILTVGSEKFTERVLSVSPDTGKAREFELAYVLPYRFVDADGKALIKPGSIRLLRDYVFDADKVIGKSRERGVLRREMRRDAVLQLLRRMESAAR